MALPQARFVARETVRVGFVLDEPHGADGAQDRIDRAVVSESKAPDLVPMCLSPRSELVSSSRGSQTFLPF